MSERGSGLERRVDYGVLNSSMARCLPSASRRCLVCTVMKTWGWPRLPST